MGWGTVDVYYQPDKFGLTQLAELDADLSYEFDMVVAWRHEDGTVYAAADSGCSCPSPFEEYTSLDKLTVIRSVADVEPLIAGMYGDVSASDIQDFKRRVRSALR